MKTTGFPGTKLSWFGYDAYEFEFDSRACKVVIPKVTAAGKPWIWRALFWGHEPQTDLALLAKGFHLVHIDVGDFFGNPEAVAHWNAFHRFLTGEHNLAKKAALEGMSRGGLIVFNWAAGNTDKVSCIYVDAPVCDIRSWPGGKGSGDGSPAEWQVCLRRHNLTEEQAMTFDGNPVDRIEPLARASIPLLHVCGADDTVVPVAENTAVVEERYKRLGGRIEVIIKKNCGHHPHSLPDPAPIVDFILKHTPGPGG